MVLAEITNDVTVALIASMTSVLVVTLPIWLNQRRTHAQIEDTNRKVGEVYEHVNNVEEGIAPEGEPTSLGQMVRQTRDELREGFGRNDADHHRIESHLDAVQTTVSANTHRITQVENHIDDQVRQDLSEETERIEPPTRRRPERR